MNTDNMQIVLTYADIALASSLIIIVLVVSWFLRLRLTKTLVIAAVRTVIQLSFIGLILAWIFAREQWYEVLIILTIMTLIAGSAAKNRVKHTYKGLLVDTLIAVSASAVLVTVIAISLILQVQPWYTPQFIIPILGLILGNSLTAISLTSNQLIENIHRQQGRIEMMLSLSAKPFEAVHEQIRAAIINGMTPTLNSMLVVGIVSLPGMMTGQILAGADPTQAVRYQIVTMFLICVSSTLGCTISALLIYRRFFNKKQQFILP
ncbi:MULTISPECIES: ABC transporter permease [unclassified Psychrobacter]|uniref:ABC transporter permease n=1 Tax=unclassified Psychrobacter TaxID=196806 RepID=UPI0025F63512|nr:MULTISPECIES: iron export ABC transporter permease subunit FetB [unclassified Psychrobacter]